MIKGISIFSLETKKKMRFKSSDTTGLNLYPSHRHPDLLQYA